MNPIRYKLTLEELLLRVTPDPVSGVFIRKGSWRSSRSGKIAGIINAKNGYRYISINSRLYSAHRLMWFFVHGEWPKSDIDHINGNRDDNRIENLRLACRSENNVNSKTPKNNTSGFKGAYFDKRRVFGSSGAWAAEIWIFKKKKFLGYFKTAEEAGVAYQTAVAKHYGEFAPLRAA